MLNELIGRICTRCLAEKLTDDFSPSACGRDGLQSWCKECRRTYLSGLRKRVTPSTPPALLHCRKCKSNKPSAEFPADKLGKYGKATECVDCKRGRNREQVRAKRRADPEAARARARAFYAANIDHYRAYYANKVRSRNQADPDKYNAHQRASYAASPHRMREAARKRRALKAGIHGPGITEEQWVSLLEYFDHRCAYCLSPAKKLEADHVVALVRGGQHEECNIVPACEQCNTSKNDKSLLELFAPRLIVAKRMLARTIPSAA